MKRPITRLAVLVAALGGGLMYVAGQGPDDDVKGVDARIRDNAAAMVRQGRQIFRFDTFGSEQFWGGTLKLHQGIAGAANGGVGAGLSPSAALAAGLKVDAAALPATLVEAVTAGKVNLNDPAVTLELLKLNAVVGVKGTFDAAGKLTAVGIQCAVCHSTVDRSFRTDAIPAGLIGARLDGWPNRDLNVGAVISLSPDLKFFSDALSVDDATVRRVFASWGPGKFDASLLLDGKAFRPDGRSGATLIPPAFGLAGVNLHTYTGWGSVSHWNALVSNLEMGGQGTFWDPRLNDAAQFPIAAKLGLGERRGNPDLTTPKLAALQIYQLSIPAPRVERNPFARTLKPGEALFNGKAKCATCHVPPIYTEPGWNMHTPAEIGIDDFQANRAPDRRYRTTPLGGMTARQKGGFYHDGRFATLLDVVNHYDRHLRLGLTDEDKMWLVEYVGSL